MPHTLSDLVVTISAGKYGFIYCPQNAGDPTSLRPVTVLQMELQTVQRCARSSTLQLSASNYGEPFVGCNPSMLPNPWSLQSTKSKHLRKNLLVFLPSAIAPSCPTVKRERIHRRIESD